MRKNTKKPSKSAYQLKQVARNKKARENSYYYQNDKGKKIPAPASMYV